MKLAEVLERAKAKDPTLTAIDLSNEEIGPEGMKELAAVLPECRALRELSLYSNNLGIEGAQALARVLPECRALRKLYLRANQLGSEGAQALARVLPECRALRVLNLESNGLGYRGAQALARVLPECRGLSELDLSNNNYLGTEGAQALARVLPECRALSVLNLGYNNLGDEETQALARVLPECRALRELNLEGGIMWMSGNGNKIGSEGAQVLARVLPECRALSVLNLSYNKLGLKGTQALARVLPECRALSELNLRISLASIGAKGAQALARVLPECRALSVLWLSGNNLGTEGAQALARVLPECRALSVLDLGNNNLEAEEEKKLHQTIDPILKRNQKRFDELMTAIAQGDLSQIKTLYEQGASLFSISVHNDSPYRGYTPLLLAVSKGKLAVVEWLLEKGCRDTLRAEKANTVAPEDQGKTALKIAKARGFKEIVALLQAANLPEAKKEAPVMALQPEVKPVVSPQPVLREIKQAPLMQSVSGQAPLATSHEIVVKVNKIAYKQLIYGERVGKGSFGIVYQGKYGFTDVAIKEFLEQHLTEESLSEFKNEATIMGQLRHPNIVTLYGICLESPHYSLVMELMPNHSLWDFLHSSQEISWEIRSNIALDITAGLAFLHDQNILHRDLKSLNVLLDGQFRAKITDFGLSKIKTETRSRTIKTKEEKDNAIGTLQWMAPELFKRNAKYSKASDIYSYGMILWELTTRKIPFAGAPEALIIQWVSSGEKEEIPKDCPEALAKVIGECWQTEGQKRISAAAALESLSLWKKEKNQPKASKEVNTLSGFFSKLFTKSKPEKENSAPSSGYRENVETKQLQKGKSP